VRVNEFAIATTGVHPLTYYLGKLWRGEVRNNRMRDLFHDDPDGLRYIQKHGNDALALIDPGAYM